MKKLLVLLFVLILTFSLCACGGDSTKNAADTQTTTTTAQATTDGGFVQPDDYAVVMLVTINPQFRLYLDEDGRVLALGAVNDDAKSIENLNVNGKGFEEALEDIIKAANAGGFIKDGGAVTIEITEAKNVDVADILSKASAAANKTATDLKIQFSVNAQDKTGSVNTDSTTTTQPTTVAPTTTAPTTAPTTAKPVLSVLNPKTNIVKDTEYIGNFYESGTELLAGALCFDDECCVVTERYFTSVKPEDEGAPPITFNGNTYYSEGGGQNPHYYELTDTEIIIKGSFWGDNPDAVTIKAVLQSDGMIKITWSNNTLFPVGAVFSTNMEDVLK